jgi:hypothetical protein
MLPAPWLPGATCRGRPSLHRSVVPRCCCRDGHRRRGAKRLWGRARVRRLPLSEWAFGRRAPVRRPAGWALPSRQDLRPARLIPLGGRRSIWCPSASSTTVWIARTLTPRRAPVAGEVVRFDVNAKHSASGRTERRPAALAVVAYPGQRGPRCSCAPYRWRGRGPSPAIVEAGGVAPEKMGENIAAVEAADRSREVPETAGSGRAMPEQGSKRAAPKQGMSDCPMKRAWVRSKMYVSNFSFCLS